MSTCIEIKREYDAFLDFLREADDEAAEEFKGYYVASALRMWGRNELYSRAYGELLGAVTGVEYTVEQIVTALGCCGEKGRRLRVPGCFGRLVQRDAKDGGRRAARFIELFSQLMAATAMVNGDFTLEEAGALAEITDGLVRWAGSQRVDVGAAPAYDDQITERLEESYYQRGTKDAADVKEQTTPLAEKSVTGSENRDLGIKHSGNSSEQMNPTNPSPEKTGDGTINIHVTIQAPGEQGQSDALKETRAPGPSAQEPAEEESLESLLAELDGLVGLEGVKRDVHSLMNFIKIAKLREARGMKVPTVSYHLVFTGNPGTGKTTVARLVARLYYQMGLLPKGQFVETDRAALVAGYLGQTALKTQKVIQQAMGGVLFIDEAYSLAGETEDSYGREAIETLLKAMEDHRDELVIIVAGYTELMHKFINSNPGLSSRFSKYFEFQDYTGSELLEIFRGFCQKNGYSLDDEAAGMLRAEFERLFEGRDRHFGNARTARNIFEKAINAQADRVARQTEIADADLELIRAADVAAALGGDRT